MSEPRVTVAIPTWNRARLLGSCLASVLAQTMPDFEVVVFDNASDDATPEVLEAITDERVSHIRNPENIGNLRNTTQALHAGTAPYVLVLYDDCYLAPTCLERKVAFLDEHPDVVLVHSAFEVRHADDRLLAASENWGGPSTDTVEDGELFIERSLLKPCRIQIASAMYRREAVADESLRREDYPADDHGLWLRIATKGSIGFIDEPLNGLRMVPGLTVASGFHDLRDGRFVNTPVTARASRDVMTRFLDERAGTMSDDRRLRRLARRGARSTWVNVLRTTVPGLRPPGRALRLLGSAVRSEPSLLLEPRMATVVFPSLRRR